MYKALLVDDELLVRTNLKLMSDWRQHGFALCGEAANGAEALALIERERPDLIVSDLRMPVMDGLQLSSELARRYPGIKMIVLSNYDDFDYVKGTLQNGAVDYLLKHRLNASALAEALASVKALLDARPQGTDGERTDANQRLALRTRFITELIAGFYRSPEEIGHHIRMLDLKLDTKQLIPVILSIDDYRSRQSRATLKAAELERFSILNIVEEIAGGARQRRGRPHRRRQVRASVLVPQRPQRDRAVARRRRSDLPHRELSANLPESLRQLQHRADLRDARPDPAQLQAGGKADAGPFSPGEKRRAAKRVHRARQRSVGGA
ncbi:response regulator [Cohnella rhizosphaerae]|uniref:Response regulator n=1 Tax=Cohnella rhizosphaerae TaxID=1457232 RepID=A0A9X4QTT8_9BACL|nr:response regulator [Cohnella rhizosphaerae]MDG0811526.1 response regulator [Cohnella rhizosphaerae]